jgi:hypothetical protein
MSAVVRSKARHARYIWLALLLFMPATLFAQQDDPANRVCLALLAQNVQDTKSVYSDEFHFNQYQSVLKTANFSSYQEYANQGASMGIDIPIADGIIGFSGDYKSDSGTFQQQMNQFLSTSYAESLARNQYSESTATMNAQYLAVARDCQDHYYDTLKDRFKLSVTVEPASYSQFILKIAGYIPPPFNQNNYLVIQQIEPASDVQCTENGSKPSFPETKQDGNAVYTCSKSDSQNIQLAVLTNLGYSQPLNLPSKVTGPPALPPPTIEVPITWAADSPVWPMGPPITCPCCSINHDETKVRITNNCNESVPIILMRDDDAEVSLTPPGYNRPGRAYAYVIVPHGKSATFDKSVAQHGMIWYLACPGLRTPDAPKVCRVDTNALPAGGPPYSCPVSQSTNLGDTCSCPKFAPPNPNPVGSFPGKVSQ